MIKPLKLLRHGGTYRVHDRRKGTFIAKCVGVNEEWARFEILEGEAHFLSDGGVSVGPGSVVSCRHVLCEYVPLSRWKPKKK